MQGNNPFVLLNGSTQFNDFLARLELTLGSVFPRTMFAFRQLINYGKEPEQDLLHLLCNTKKTSIDIGANAGSYTHLLLKYSQNVVAFEPNPVYHKRLQKIFGRQKLRLETVALSNHSGKTILKVPWPINGLGTIEKSNTLEDIFGNKKIKYVPVKIEKLDEYKISNIGFIKIDVEGHEFAVIKGAIQSIKKSFPNLLVEIFEKHNPGSFSRVSQMLAGLGYKAYFYNVGKMLPIPSSWKRDPHYELKKMTFIYNFIFLHKKSVSTDLARFIKNPTLRFADGVLS